jgi:predicted N-acetyltransferase YhbS
MVGSVRLTSVRIGTTPALLLGPLTIEPPFRDKGIGKAMMERALKDAKEKGHTLVVLVGDEPYYARVGFKRVPNGAITMPGPADPGRILAVELIEGALKDVRGVVQPDWDA